MIVDNTQVIGPIVFSGATSANQKPIAHQRARHIVSYFASEWFFGDKVFCKKQGSQWFGEILECINGVGAKAIYILGADKIFFFYIRIHDLKIKRMSPHGANYLPFFYGDSC